MAPDAVVDRAANALSVRTGVRRRLGFRRLRRIGGHRLGGIRRRLLRLSDRIIGLHRLLIELARQRGRRERRRQSATQDQFNECGAHDVLHSGPPDWESVAPPQLGARRGARRATSRPPDHVMLIAWPPDPHRSIAATLPPSTVTTAPVLARALTRWTKAAATSLASTSRFNRLPRM